MNGIEVYRKKQKITQCELANKMGISQANVSQWENGEALPRTDKLPLLAKILNCTIDELFGNEKQNLRAEPASKAKSALAMCDKNLTE